MIVGSGNDRPTPKICLDILNHDPYDDPEPVITESIGEGLLYLFVCDLPYKRYETI